MLNNEDDKRIERFERQAAEFSRHNLSVVAVLNIPEGAEDFIRTTAGGQPLTSAMLTRVTEERRIVQNKKKEKDRHFNELKQLIEHLNDRLEKIDQRLEEIEAELGEIDKLEKLAEEGKLDPNNPEHAKLMKKYNIKEKDIETGHIFAILGGRRSELETERGALEEERKDVEHQVRKAREINHRIEENLDRTQVEFNKIAEKRGELLQKKAGLTDEEAKILSSLEEERERLEEERARLTDQAEALREQRKEAIAYKALDIRNQQVDLEKQDGVWDRAEREGNLHDRRTELKVEDEVEHFMKEFSVAQKIKDELERLTREKELVAGLSEEAAENVSWEESTEHLFEAGYFDELNTETVVAESTVPGTNHNPSLG